jgi:hypothetical protein
MQRQNVLALWIWNQLCRRREASHFYCSRRSSFGCIHQKDCFVARNFEWRASESDSEVLLASFQICTFYIICVSHLSPFQIYSEWGCLMFVLCHDPHAFLATRSDDCGWLGIVLQLCEGMHSEIIAAVCELGAPQYRRITIWIIVNGEQFQNRMFSSQNDAARSAAKICAYMTDALLYLGQNSDRYAPLSHMATMEQDNINLCYSVVRLCENWKACSRSNLICYIYSSQ